MAPLSPAQISRFYRKLLTGFILLSAAPVFAGDKPSRMTFRNNVIPGHVTGHVVRRTTTRIAQRPKGRETLVFSQEGLWVQCNIEDPAPAQVVLYQMTADQPARVDSQRTGKREVRKPPPASRFGLPGGAVRLQSDRRTPTDSPVLPAVGDDVQTVLTSVLLDFAHWPAKPLPTGHRWERTISTPQFEGTQTFEFVDIGPMGKDVAGRLTMLVRGKFKGPLARTHTFDQAQALIHWSRPQRLLLKMEAQARYARRRGNDVEKFTMRLDVLPRQVLALDEAAQESVKVEIGLLAAALKEQSAGHWREVRDLCVQFRQQNPKSFWLPALQDVESRLAAAQRPTKRFTREQLDELLTRTIVTWEAARGSREFDIADNCRRVFTDLSREYTAMLRRQVEDSSAPEDARGRAAFALAFSDKPEDAEIVRRMARDSSPKVRALVLGGVTARAGPRTDAAMLLSALDDENRAVRRRACEAVAVCVTRENLLVAQLVEKLDRLMVHDKDAVLRREAIRALVEIGSPLDAAKLEKALKYELNAENREALDVGIARLKTRG